MSTVKALVPDNGWQLLIAIIAAETVSPDLLTVDPVPRQRRVVREDCITADGTTTTHREQTPEEEDRLSEMVDSYLTDAGVQPLPRPVAVHLTLPDGVKDMDQLGELVQADLWDRELTHPSAWAAALREVLPGRYADPT
ncbi:DUF5956 family protein [Microbacterium aureliae]